MHRFPHAMRPVPDLAASLPASVIATHISPSPPVSSGSNREPMQLSSTQPTPAERVRHFLGESTVSTSFTFCETKVIFKIQNEMLDIETQ